MEKAFTAKQVTKIKKTYFVRGFLIGLSAMCVFQLAIQLMVGN